MISVTLEYLFMLYCISTYGWHVLFFYSSKRLNASLNVVCLCCQEGKQASLAADFSVTQFKHLGRLLMVHGRNSYKRSAALSQFVIHRSLCISTMQVAFVSICICEKECKLLPMLMNRSVFSGFTFQFVIQLRKLILNPKIIFLHTQALARIMP